MIRFVCIVLSFFLISTIQKERITVTGKIYDGNDTLKNISYVNIGFKKAKHSWVSDSKGNFSFKIKHNQLNEQIHFSAVGYEQKTMSVKELISLDGTRQHIYLFEDTLFLKPIIIKPQGGKKAQIADKKIKERRRSVSFSFPTKEAVYEIAKKITLPDKEAVLSNIKFYVIKNTIPNLVFRINIYDTVNGKPGKKLQNENIISTMGNQRFGIINIDVSQYRILLDQGFFIAIEIIQTSNSAKKVTYKTNQEISVEITSAQGYPLPLYLSAIKSKEENNTFVRTNAFGQWAAMPKNFGLNMMVEAEVYELNH